jgi:hypothetical protein
MRWDHWTMKPDGGSAAVPDVIEPGAWLLAYWMGRYHGFIEAPDVTDSANVRVDRKQNNQLGAKPYVGPQRPKSLQSRSTHD